MKIQFLGTGAAEGVPAVFCNCNICKNIRSIGESEFRTRSQVIIDDCLSIDFPSEAFMHSLKFGVQLSALKYLLITHSHMDHFYAHDFILRGYKYAELSENLLEIYGNAEVGKVFNECTFREMKPSVSEHLKFTEIKPYQIFNVGEYRIISLPANHSNTEEALLFYVEREGKGYLHFYDTGRIIDDGFYKFLKDNRVNPDVICFDCTFVENTGGVSARHMGIEDNIFIRQKLFDYGILNKHTKIIISHFSHNSNPTREHLKLIEKKYNVVSAYDGLELKI